MPDDWRLTPAAQGDFGKIYDFGADRWSEDQAVRYARELREVFSLLASQPRMARERPEFGHGIRVHPHGAHAVFYRAVRDGIEIVRIAHGRSDWRVLFD